MAISEYDMPWNKKQVLLYREEMGLDPIKKGERLCLACDQPFYSFNLKTNKMCEHCRVRSDESDLNIHG